MNKALAISIIIPVYNEERHLKVCLESIAAQSRKPDEVLVVDNNSTDASADIAAAFPFVRIVQEKTQGLIAARNKGFKAAKGDILARIDADVRLPKDWVSRVVDAFSKTDIAGVSGPGLTYTLPRVPWLLTTLWSRIYFVSTEAFHRIPILWGANMAIRKSAWAAIKSDVCLDDDLVHEDQDLSYLLAGKGLRVVRDNALRILTRDDSYFGWYKYKNYYLRRIWTRRYHREKGTLKQASVTRYSELLCLWMSVVMSPYVIVFSVSSFIAGIPEIVRHRLK